MKEGLLRPFCLKTFIKFSLCSYWLNVWIMNSGHQSIFSLSKSGEVIATGDTLHLQSLEKPWQKSMFITGKIMRSHGNRACSSTFQKHNWGQIVQPRHSLSSQANTEMFCDTECDTWYYKIKGLCLFSLKIWQQCVLYSRIWMIFYGKLSSFAITQF